MKKLFSKTGGFTLTEVLFATFITVIVVTAIMSAWIFSAKQWTGESEISGLRVSIMKAVHTLKHDLRLTSLVYVSLYPVDTSPATGISLPLAEVDANGFLTLDSDGKIAWDKTVIYHLYNEGDGTKTLRRTVYDPRDNTMTSAERYTQLATVVSSGEGSGDDYSTDTTFMPYAETFDISSMSVIFDFYDASATIERGAEETFGWVQLDPGAHTFKFEITGQNASSSGLDIAVDEITISPCGRAREAEFYNSAEAPVGALTLSGGTASRVYDTDYSNENYLLFDATAEGDYMQIADDYDLWRESAFDAASLSNTEKTLEQVRISLDVPDQLEAGVITWEGYAEAGDSTTSGSDASFSSTTIFAPSGVTMPVTIRNVITAANIDQNGNFVRIKFKASSTDSLVIDKAYITLRDSGANGLANQTTTALTIDQYHRHQQLFFDSGGTIVENVTISAGSSAWTEWTAFPIKSTGDYFITMYLSDAGNTTCLYFDGSSPGGTTHSYYLDATAWTLGALAGTATTDIITLVSHPFVDDDILIFNNVDGGVGISNSALATNGLAEAAGTPAWNAYYVQVVNADSFRISVTPNGAGWSTVDILVDDASFDYIEVQPSDHIFIASDIDRRTATGTVESRVCDTSITAPVYNELKWSESKPTNGTISFKARTSSSACMFGATGWSSIAEITSSPTSLSIGNGRYVQFKATLYSEPTWDGGSGETAYDTYVDAQVALNDYTFPTDFTGIMVTTTPAVWLDNVEIDWGATSRMCAIKAHVGKRDDFGQAKLVVDGYDLLHSLGVDIKVQKTVQGRVLSEESYFEIEPKNTGR